MACGKSKRQIEELLADRAPKPDVDLSIRKCPEKGGGLARARPAEKAVRAGSQQSPGDSETVVTSTTAWIKWLAEVDDG